MHTNKDVTAATIEAKGFSYGKIVFLLVVSRENPISFLQRLLNAAEWAQEKIRVSSQAALAPVRYILNAMATSQEDVGLPTPTHQPTPVANPDTLPKPTPQQPTPH